MFISPLISLSLSLVLIYFSIRSQKKRYFGSQEEGFIAWGPEGMQSLILQWFYEFPFDSFDSSRLLCPMFTLNPSMLDIFLARAEWWGGEEEVRRRPSGEETIRYPSTLSSSFWEANKIKRRSGRVCVCVCVCECERERERERERDWLIHQ